MVHFQNFSNETAMSLQIVSLPTLPLGIQASFFYFFYFVNVHVLQLNIYGL